MFTNVAGKPLSAPEFRPVFAAHGGSTTCRSGCIRCAAAQFSDYASEKESQNEIWFSFGWPYETTACMTRLIYSGIFDELPGLKIISHHMGGMIPYLLRQDQARLPADFLRHAGPQSGGRGRRAEEAAASIITRCSMPTPRCGEVAPTRCGHAFFGTDQCLFATDAPFDAEQGRGLMRNTIAAVNALEISQARRTRYLPAMRRSC